jgi:hypothetical protein
MEYRSLGHRAYDEDCRRCPCYQDGEKRPSWWSLSEVARQEWEKHPTPRNYDLRPREGDRVLVSGVSRTGQHVYNCSGSMLSDRCDTKLDEIELDQWGRHQFDHSLADYEIRVIAR